MAEKIKRAEPVRNAVVRRSIRRFVAAALAALGVVSIASVLVAESISREIALQEAVTRGRTFARAVSGPLVDAGMRRGDANSVATFSRVMQNRLQEGSMVHLRVWDADGRILWSDQQGLLGRKFELHRDVAAVLESGSAIGSVSEVDGLEGVAKVDDGELLEVYAAARSQTGDPIIVNSYWSAERLDDSANAVLGRIAPLSVGSLTLLALVVFPLAWSLARRVERVQGENGVLVQHALDASDAERRRIARDLHDGVLQDVTVVGYQLATAVHTDAEHPARSRHLLDQAFDGVRRIGESLRSTLADIYPVDLTSQGLGPAVEELAMRAREEAGVEVRVDIRGLTGESCEVLRLSYRVIREGLHNVVRHAHARHAEVVATRRGDTIHLRVDDDGVGPGNGDGGQGHLGLTLLRDTMHDIGGTFTIASRPGGGTHLSASFPRDVATG
jgi:signal transduction histidine kinase